MRVTCLHTHRALPAAALVAALLGLSGCNGGKPASVDEAAAEFRPTTLLDSVLVGDRAAVEQFVTHGANVNAAERDGTTPLMRAIHGGFPQIARRLIAAGADVSATNSYGVSPLYLAARAMDADTTQALLAAGADANTSLPEGETVLMTAAKAGAADIVRALLTGGSGILALSAIDDTQNAGAVSSGYGAVTLPAGPRNRADPNAKEGWYGQTAAMWAAAEGHADVLRLLVAAGANLNERSRVVETAPLDDEGPGAGSIAKGGLTALHLAAREGHLEAVRALLDGGADVDTVDGEGRTATLLATLKAHLDVARALLAAGADPKIADRYGRTVLFAAADSSSAAANDRSGSPDASTVTATDIVSLALARGADPNGALRTSLPGDTTGDADHDSILQRGATPLLRAAMSNDVALMTLLLAAGADPRAATDARDPVTLAGVERPSNGRTTVLMAAAGVGWRESMSRGREADALEALELLLAKGADVNAANQMGDTALHGATLRGSTAIIQFLVDHGANVRAKNAKGQTPLDIAVGVPDDRIPYNEATAALLRRLSHTG